MSFFFIALLCPATSKNFSSFTQAFLYPIPEIVKTLLNDESAAVPTISTPVKCTISPPPLKQVRVIRYKIRVLTILLKTRDSQEEYE